MGYCIVFATCAACRVPIAVNPTRCPSIRVGGVGPRQPICERCFHRWNQIHRVSKGLPPEKLLDGAYAPCDESEVP